MKKTSVKRIIVLCLVALMLLFIIAAPLYNIFVYRW